MQIGVLVGFSVISALALLPGCAEPIPVRWSEQLAVIEPTAPPPQGSLEVYSERFLAWDGDVPRTTRRPVKVYSIDGQLVTSSSEQDGESPIRFSLTPGRYVVASEDRMQWRKLQVDVKNGQNTIVTESQWDAAPLLASSSSENTPQMAAHKLDGPPSNPAPRN
jgi:hypothetical protein